LDLLDVEFHTDTRQVLLENLSHRWPRIGA
jgi:hypothetical protein